MLNEGTVFLGAPLLYLPSECIWWNSSWVMSENALWPRVYLGAGTWLLCFWINSKKCVRIKWRSRKRCQNKAERTNPRAPFFATNRCNSFTTIIAYHNYSSKSRSGPQHHERHRILFRVPRPMTEILRREVLPLARPRERRFLWLTQKLKSQEVVRKMQCGTTCFFVKSKMTRTLEAFKVRFRSFRVMPTSNLNALNSWLLLRVLLLDSLFFSCVSVNVREQGFLPRWEAGALQ
jgi:hypothetical protein